MKSMALLEFIPTYSLKLNFNNKQTDWIKGLKHDLLNN